MNTPMVVSALVIKEGTTILVLTLSDKDMYGTDNDDDLSFSPVILSSHNHNKTLIIRWKVRGYQRYIIDETVVITRSSDSS